MKKGKVTNGNEPPTYQEATAGYEDMEAQFAWDDKTIRQTFIRKVYAILMVQLLVTVAIVAVFSFCTPVRFFIQTHPGLYMASYLMFFCTYIALTCCGDLRRQFPWNIILLILFVSVRHHDNNTNTQNNTTYSLITTFFFLQTLSMAFMMGFMSSFYNTKSVVLCLGITSLVCLSVTIFSFQSKIDVTSCHGVLFSLCVVMLLCSITLSIVVPFGYVPWLHAIYAVGGAILFTLFLAFDTQLLLGNKRYTISPEEYIFATLSIYLDIIYLFSFLLQIMGGGRE
ncbi:fas apoptotic inhibitory molecule 2b isoform X2 [Antennarius striatus]|uniref:fas apoptotic inhibitory molecule 2b isoform X2 n=1 Tax=Antennarius striatus TaxID=241820 RepID=UPI0035B03607